MGIPVLRFASLSQSALIGSGVLKRVSRSAGSAQATLDARLAKAGCLARKLAIPLAPQSCQWETLNAGQKVSATKTAAKQSLAPTATPSAGTASTTMTDAASPRRNYKCEPA